MIELVEEPYDGPAGTALVAQLLSDLNERYSAWAVGLDGEALRAADARYLASVTPDEVRRPAGTFVVARVDGQPAGCGALLRYRPYHADGPDLGEAVAEVKRMYTAQWARRRGVSRSVLARLEAVAAELGYRRLVLETGTEQPEALALYADAGWTPIEPYGSYRDEPSSRCLAKDLAR